MASNLHFNPQFYADALVPAHADAAYPLVRAIAPEVTLEEWLDYVVRRCREGGLMGLFCNDDTLVGLFSYRFGERLRHGRVLALDDFVTFELSQAAPARAVLMTAAVNLARSLGCTGLEVRVGSRGIADPKSARASGWLALGVELDSVIFVKPL